MAQQDTGMGWNAKSEWLLNSAGTIAAYHIIGGSSYPNQPIPKNCKTSQDVVTANFKAGYIQRRYYRSTYWVAAKDDVDMLAFRVLQSGWYNIYLASPTRNAVGQFVDLVSSTGAYSIYSETLSGHDSVTGLWYTHRAMSFDSSTETLVNYLPEFNSLREALDAIQIIDIPYIKLNPGYAVACVAEWYTPEGTDLISPILISTNPLFTVISTNGTTPATNLSTFDFLKDGTRFYMSLIGGNTEQLESVLEFADLRQFAAAAPSKVFSLIASESFANIQITDSPDPYGETAEEEGGGGNDEEDNPVEEETMSLPGVAGFGFCTIYVPSDTDLYNLAAYLWGGNLDLNNFLRLFSNPMDSILGLSAVPVSLSGTASSVYMGGQILQNLTLPKYTGRTSVKVDMGTMTIKERWGAYLDYDPYTELSLYLPFIGIKNIKADDVMGKNISLMYSIDIMSGACVAYIRPSGGSVLYEWSGQCALQIPVTSQNWDNIFATAATTAAAIGSALFAPSAVSAGAIASASVQAISAKPRVERSGAVNGITGFLGQLRPYLIRVIPEAYIPADQNKFIGYPSFIKANLGTLTGYNEISSIHLEGIPATGNELSEIETLLKGGVIF